jgi:protein-L-isoaspartate O-methyltransferase
MDMLETLDIRPGARVLEIGAGTGWNAALMAHLVESSGSVVSIDNQPDVARRARRHIKRAGLKNVHIVTGDGAHGYPKAAPYDRLITTVSCPDVFPAWWQQLKPGGIAVITLSELPGESMCLMLKLRKTKTHLKGEMVNLPGFMLFTGKHGSPPTSRQAQQRLDEHDGARVRKHRALWAILPGQGDIVMRRDLAFFARLEGLRVESLENRFVLSSHDDRGLCVLDKTHIDVVGSNECYSLYEKVQDRWLHLGAPKRRQYRVEVWPLAVKKRQPRDGWLARRSHCQLIFRLK